MHNFATLAVTVKKCENRPTMQTLFFFPDSVAAIVIIVMACGYFSGAIPFGLIFARLVSGKDIRQMGSGGTGATNVLRNTNKTTALLTLIADVLKGVVPCAIFLHISPPLIASELALITGLAAVIGHIFPCWANFQGGKGFATALGVIAMLQGSLVLFCVGVWLIVAAISRFSSLASLLSLLALPINALIIELDLSHIFIFTLMVLLVTTRHRENIRRLLAHQESTLGFLDSRPIVAPSPNVENFASGNITTEEARIEEGSTSPVPESFSEEDGQSSPPDVATPEPPTDAPIDVEEKVKDSFSPTPSASKRKKGYIRANLTETPQ